MKMFSLTCPHGRRRFLGIAWAIALLGIASAALAELSLTQATLSGSTAVIVNESDGKTVRGTITQCTPELLSVMPAPKPNSKIAPPATEPVEVPWKQIRSVTGGLNARLATDIWIAQHAGQLCPTCHGERTIWCPTCKGTNHDPASATTCPTCKGELLIDCKTPGEIKGQIPCPNSCLKLGVGNWVKHPDGSMWRQWHFNFGSSYAMQEWSTHHVGDVMVTDLKASPPIADQGKCPVCGGTSKVDDPLCFGTGQKPCPTCLARTSAPPCPNHCDSGRVVCPTCGGTGLPTAENPPKT